jgi:hypothetical protein
MPVTEQAERKEFRADIVFESEGYQLLSVTQLPLAKWHQAIDEPTLADAIMDRLSASAHCIELKGPSKRTRKSK